MDRPVLFCYDGSEGSKAALSVAVELVMHPADAVVLAVWKPIAIQVARGGSLAASVPNEGQLDEEEIAAAQRIADEGAAGRAAAPRCLTSVSRGLFAKGGASLIPKAQLVLYPDAGHAVWFQDQARFCATDRSLPQMTRHP